MAYLAVFEVVVLCTRILELLEKCAVVSFDRWSDKTSPFSTRTKPVRERDFRWADTFRGEIMSQLFEVR